MHVQHRHQCRQHRHPQQQGQVVDATEGEVAQRSRPLVAPGEDPPVEQQEVPGGGALGRRDGTGHVVDAPEADRRPEQELIDDDPTQANEGKSTDEEAPQCRGPEPGPLAVFRTDSGQLTKKKARGRAITVRCSQEMLLLIRDRREPLAHLALVERPYLDRRSG